MEACQEKWQLQRQIYAIHICERGSFIAHLASFTVQNFPTPLFLTEHSANNTITHME